MGVISLFTALLHTIGGQISLINPMLSSNLDLQVKSELLGVWHLVTVVLWVFGFVLVKNGWNFKTHNNTLVKMIGIVYFLFGLVFIFITIFQQQHTPQYILFLPMALLIFIGNKKVQKIHT